MTWTDERVSRLVEMVETGRPIRLISLELGVSKNAVVGKLYRLRHKPPKQRARKAERKAPSARFRFRRCTVPENVHPIVRRLFHEMNAQRTTVMDISERTGISFNTIHKWKRRAAPNIANLEACFNALGKTLVVKETAE